MGRRNQEDEKRVQEAVRDYASSYAVNNKIKASVSDIAEVVASELGFTPSTATVRKFLLALGYKPSATSWEK
jgi:hypothetical protein